MRISDWSSDVCSSDLVEIAQEAFLVVLQQDKCSGDWVFGIGEAQQPPPWWFCRESRNTRRSDLPNSQLPIPNPGSKGTSMRWFEIALVVLTLLSGLVWLLDNLFLAKRRARSEEHTSELQSLMRISYAVFCLKKKKTQNNTSIPTS